MCLADNGQCRLCIAEMKEPIYLRSNKRIEVDAERVDGAFGNDHTVVRFAFINQYQTGSSREL